MFNQLNHQGPPNSFYIVCITLIPKIDTTKKGRLHINNSYKFRCRNLQQHINKLNLTMYKNNYTPQPNGIYS